MSQGLFYIEDIIFSSKNLRGGKECRQGRGREGERESEREVSFICWFTRKCHKSRG